MRLSLVSGILSCSLAQALIGANAFAAACCGGGSAAPNVITSDDRAQVVTSVSDTSVVIDNVDSGGVWRTWDHHVEVRTLRIDGATLIDDRWQAGFALPVIERTRLGQNYSGLGDLAATLGYEYLPDWDYSALRPKGIGFFQLTLPTGRSRYESNLGGLDSRGNGFWSAGFGTVLSKIIHRWDVLSSIEVHRSFAKQIQNSQFDGVAHPGIGGNLAMGAGYNWQQLRLGSSLTWTYEDAVSIDAGSNSTPGAVERYATLVLAASSTFGEEWSGSLTYGDQTLFGSPTNTSLGRTVGLQAVRRWGR